MAKRTICIQSAAKLSSRQDSLVVSSADKEARIPFEDIWVVIVENTRTVLTASLMATIAEYGIGLIVCGKNHMPTALQLPLAAHSRHAAIVERQLLISKPLKKQLWQRIVKQKIENQAQCLEFLGRDGSKNLRVYARSVMSGDSTGREAVAASAYFRELIRDGTRREGPYAAPLDYGYAVIRAGIGREAVAGGWLVSRGLHHCSDLNPFNLVDDLIEPFRPVVDLLVESKGLTADFNRQTRAELSQLFEYAVLIDGRKHSLQSAIELTLESLKRCVVQQDSSLLQLPALLPLEKTEMERK